MRKRVLWTASVLALFSGSNALAQDSIVEHLVAACETDIENYCSQVTPGNGRMLHCMAAHEDKISGQCEYAFYQAASLLEQLSVAINYLAQECKTEIQTLCSDVEMGDGRILACLDEQPEKVGEGCKKAIADTVSN
jgi:Cysteine rich repeat